jgi:hypothetical protein
MVSNNETGFTLVLEATGKLDKPRLEQATADDGKSAID